MTVILPAPGSARFAIKFHISRTSGKCPCAECSFQSANLRAEIKRIVEIFEGFSCLNFVQSQGQLFHTVRAWRS
jgi:hypothetical protein